MDAAEVAPDLHLVRIPIPSPLAEVNCYLARGDHGWTIVDTGFHTTAAEAAWLAALRALGIAPQDVVQIVVTHFHPDHFGAAGWLQELSGAAVLMHGAEAGTARRVWSDAFTVEMAVFFREHGMPGAAAAPLSALRDETLWRILPTPRVTPIGDGQEIQVGRRVFQVLRMPGHTPDLIVLWNADEGILLANDLVLSPISPNISAGPMADPDPLGDYLASLDRAGRLPARLTLTGHRDPIKDLAARCAALQDHHRLRLAHTLELVDGARTAWEVGQALFAGAIHSPATMMFALGETVAHLEYLRVRDRVRRRRSDDGLLRYERA